MTRQRVVSSLRELAAALGSAAAGSEWYLFGSVNRDELCAADIDLMILCTNDYQADALRLAINLDNFMLPLHLALLTFDEAAQIEAVRAQHSTAIYP